MSIPRVSDKGYQMFALAHFIPFDVDRPLLQPGQTADDVFKSAQFSDRHLQILDNWESIHECQDERDAERMRKRAEMSRESRAMTRALHGSIEAEQGIDIDIASTRGKKSRDAQAELLVGLMQQCGWIRNDRLRVDIETYSTPPTDNFEYPAPTRSQLKEWTLSIKQQENMMMARRRNASNVGEQAEIHESETPTSHTHVPLRSPLALDGRPVPATETFTCSTEPSSVAETLHAVAKKFSLNEKQTMVYNIIARRFVDQHVFKVENKGEPLRMLMTGPGGTGKTHAVRALQELMKLYKLQHLIRFLGPTGTSAKQIGGTTIHKGLGLSVALKSNGRGNRKVGESNEDFTVSMSVKNRSLVRDEWWHVSFVFVDEVSLVGAQLLFQIDHALRFAKEKREEWFGGINVIFAGDFYQYPPVGSTPLYTPIQPKAPQRAADIEKRLGRLAWKSVNAVISLSEQQRMKDDPEFAAAVGRLRVRECNLGDIELFNKRVVKSAKNSHGLQMHGDRGKAIMLVGTNFIRELLNNKKAKSLCTGELVYCAAHDLIDGAEPTIDERKRLLNLDVTDFTSEGALPGFILLFVGMPVILRNRNISTELGITNGSQGVVRQVFTKPCLNNYSVPICIVVEFPDSTVEIPGLPSHCFPLTPFTWKFNTSLEDGKGGKRNAHVLRTKMNLQPAYAITGHAAQGKTLPQVFVNLSEGGFAAYVSASRAQTREGLFLTETVSLDKLNRPVNSDLRHECRRLERLEYNTRINHGIETGPILSALDPESETSMSDLGMKVPPSAAETISDRLQSLSETAAPAPPRFRPNPPNCDNTSLPPAGCVWSANSCAYDAFLMVMFSTYQNGAEAWRQTLQTMGPWFLFLANEFKCLTTPSHLTNPQSFCESRDKLRSLLSQHDPRTFPPPGLCHTSVLQIFEAFAENSHWNLTLSQRFMCPTGCLAERKTIYLPRACNSSNWINAVRRTGFSCTLENVSIQLFVDLQIAAKIQQGQGSHCDQCDSPRTTSVFLANPSPWLFFHLPTNAHPHPQPSHTLEIRGTTDIMIYRLSAVVYYNSTHFTAVWVNKDASCWGHDGLAHNGKPERLYSRDLTTVRSYAGCDPHVVLYGLDCPTTS